MRPWTGAAAALARRVAHFVRHGGDFDALAVDLHHHQLATCRVRRSLTDRAPRTWTEIPAVPVSLFQELEVGTVSGPVVFRTSGTSTGRRGVHRMRSTRLADLGARTWAARCVDDLPAAGLALLPSPDEAPDSSLGHLVSVLCPAMTWHVRNGRVDAASLEQRLAVAHDPLFVPASAFALADWLDAEPPPLPGGSVLMVTGGMKGRRREVDEADLLASARAHLAPARIVREYGMTELSSEGWSGETGPYRLPPWLRAVARDPASGTPLPAGEPGQLGFVDLCNLDASVAVETLDHGICHDPHTVVLLGRLPGAEPRGCSLAIEDPT
jgi:hypothetical protein